jgi:uroporphyrinogen-III synthase
VTRRRTAPSALAGRTIVVTRPAERSGHLVSALEDRGARVIVAPSIALRPVRSAALTAALRDLAAGRFAWITLTSPATIAMLADRLTMPDDVRAKVAAIGDGTAAAFERYAGRPADLRPRAFTTEGLARAFPRGDGRVLCPRADIAPEGLEDALVAKGWTPLRVDAYRTVLPATLPKTARDALANAEVDAITFTSASTVRGFVGAVGGVRGAPKVVCIGPVTAKEARTHGLTVHAVADPHTTEGLVAALERVFTPRPRGSRTTRDLR